MTYQEKNSILSILSSIAVFVIYYIIVMAKYPVSNVLSDVLKFWAWSMVIMVPVQVVIKIMIEIVFMLVNRLVTKEIEPSFSDELDKMVQLKSFRNAFIAFLMVFFIGIASLIVITSLKVMFSIFFFGLILIGIVGDLSTFIYYRRGF